MQDGASFYIPYIQPDAIVVFGALLMFGVLGGIMANRIRWMPTITAFMLLGFAVGPSGFGLVSKAMLMDARVLIDIALGLIMYKLGNMLHPKAMMRSKKLMATAAAEGGLTFVFVFAVVTGLGYDAMLAAFIGAIAVSSSPAVLVHVASEMRAKGPVTERAKSLVAINNLLSFVIFSAALPFAMVSEERGMSDVFIMPLYRLAGATALGIAIGWLAVKIARMLRPQDEHYRFAIVIGAVMSSLGLAGMLHTSALFAPLVLGLATRWFETSKHNLSRVGLGEGGDLFFIVLFVMAGAKIDPASLLETGFIPVLLVVVRCCGKFAGIYLTSKYAGVDKTGALATSLLMIPMAGMAIGLATAMGDLVPDIGARISAIVFATVAVFEAVGPFAASHAFRMTDEAGKDESGDK